MVRIREGKVSRLEIKALFKPMLNVKASTVAIANDSLKNLRRRSLNQRNDNEV